MGREGLEDGVMGVMRFCKRPSRAVPRRLHHRYATTGFEVHGEDGSLIGRDCMTQTPKGEVTLRSAAGEEAVKLDHENLYARSVRLFQEAVAGAARPAATGEDGVKSLSVALSDARSGALGRETAIDLEV